MLRLVVPAEALWGFLLLTAGISWILQLEAVRGELATVEMDLLQYAGVLLLPRGASRRVAGRDHALRCGAGPSGQPLRVPRDPGDRRPERWVGPGAAYGTMSRADAPARLGAEQAEQVAKQSADDQDGLTVADAEASPGLLPPPHPQQGRLQGMLSVNAVSGDV